MLGSSSGDPYWHHATTSSPSWTRAACARPSWTSVLEGPVGVVGAFLVRAHGVEPRAPAAAEDAVVSLHHRGEGVPGVGRERSGGVRAHGRSVSSLIFRTAKHLWG